MNQLVKAGKNALSKFAPGAISRASRAVGMIAGDEAARRAELAGALATIMATVGAFMSARRARRVLEHMEQNPTLSFEKLMASFSGLGDDERELAEAEVRRMITHLGDALAPEAVVPMLRAIASWSEDGLAREDCVNICRALRDLDRTELAALTEIVIEALQRSPDSELLLRTDEGSALSVMAGGSLVPLNHSRDASRLLRRLRDCELGRSDNSAPSTQAVVVARHRLELLRRVLS